MLQFFQNVLKRLSEIVRMFSEIDQSIATVCHMVSHYVTVCHSMLQCVT
jgi:hypothetical protein